ncbi:MAG: Cna B-type domain-containing protein [Clostridia bacterium]|nr:Cna B-type domain-containing protein [Clostridia bacterium]
MHTFAKRIIALTLALLMLAGVFAALADELVEYSGGVSVWAMRVNGDYAVTLQVENLDGSIAQSVTVGVNAGATLNATDYEAFNSWYTWYDEAGNVVDLSTQTYTADTVLTARATYDAAPYANLYVCIDGTWSKLETANRLYHTYDASSQRWLITAAQLAACYQTYGFLPDVYNATSLYKFAYCSVGATGVYADTTPVEYFGAYALPLSTRGWIDQYDIYYLPNNSSRIDGAGISSYAGANTFYTITVNAYDKAAEVVRGTTYSDNVLTGADKPVVLAGETLTITVPAFDGREWTCTNGTSTITGTTANGFTTFSISSVSAATTLELSHPTVAPGAQINFQVYLDDQWKTVSQSSNLYGPYNDRYMVAVDELIDVFDSYGLSTDADAVMSNNPFAYSDPDKDQMWRDTAYTIYYSESMLPLSGKTAVNVYYLPNQTGSGVYLTEIGPPNAFYTLTLHEAATGLSASYILPRDTNLTTWWNGTAPDTLPGWVYEFSEYDWYQGSADGDTWSWEAGRTIGEKLDLYAVMPTYTVTLRQDAADGEKLASVSGVVKHTSLADWLEANDGLALSNNKTVHDYNWMWLDEDNHVEIGTTQITGDVTLVGTLKPRYTVTFLAVKDGETGGSFTDSTIPTSIIVLEGDTVPELFIAQMRDNITLAEGFAFRQWLFEGDQVASGSMTFTEKTSVQSHLTVWGEYTTEVTVNFYADSAKTQADVLKNYNQKYPVGAKLTDDQYPTEDEIMSVAPAADMRFRYWVNINTGKVFTPDSEPVMTDLELYPVFERSIFRFMDKESGQQLTILYDDDQLKYDAPKVDGQYYAGLLVEDEDGNSILIPNGTAVSETFFADNGVNIPASVDGYYDVEATPVYKPLRYVTYHAGDTGAFIITTGDTYTVPVEEEVTLLGALDIANTASSIGLALAGWTTDPDGTTAEYAPHETITNADGKLDALVEASETVHLYPVWEQQDNTVAVRFESNYPDDATDEKGNALAEKAYIIYIRSGTKPTMPTLERVQITEPVNKTSENDARYVLAGWSITKNEHVASGSLESDGTYIPGSQYVNSLTTDTIFYAKWVDQEPTATTTYGAEFFIRGDGTLPTEPKEHADTSAYYAIGGHEEIGGYIYKRINIANDVSKVEANIKTEPMPETIIQKLKEGGYSRSAELETLGAAGYGTTWWVDWYACKDAGCTYYHIDGRIRFATQVELNYHSNGGSTNVPDGEVANKGETLNVVFEKVQMPSRDNFTFLGWDPNANATYPSYPVDGSGLTSIEMNKDEDLYAIWSANAIAIPMNDDFKGMKYEQTNSEAQKAPENTYSFTIEATEVPAGAMPYGPITKTNNAAGSFTFDQIMVQVPGTYVFEVREVAGSLPVQYDTSVYELSIRIDETDYGLGIAGYSFMKNGKVLSVTTSSVDDVVFEFVNRTDVRDITVTKEWADNEDQDGLRPSSVEVELYRDDTMMEKQTLTAANGWTHTWEDLDIRDGDSSAQYQYTVKEVATPNGYTSEITGDMNSGYTITNTHTPQTADFSVVKTWEDANNIDGYRPTELTYTIEGTTLAGVAAVKQTKTVNEPFSWTFEDLPRFYKGEPVTYTLTESAVDGYSTAILESGAHSDGGKTFYVTNTAEVATVTVTKQVEGNAADPAKEFTFTAMVYDAAGAQVTSLKVPDGALYTAGTDGTISFKLAAGQSIDLQWLPIGGTIQLAEENGPYTLTWSDSTDGRYAITAGLDVVATNALSASVPTGVVLDRWPYLILLGVSLVGLLVWPAWKKRRNA